MALSGTATVKDLGKYRAMYEGKLIKLNSLVGIVGKVETWGEHYPEYMRDNPLHRDRDCLVFDMKDRDGGVRNYWLTPDRMEVWGE